MIIADHSPHARLRLERRIVRRDEDRAGDRILPLGRRLRAPEDFHPVDVPQRRCAEYELVVGLPPSVDDQRHTRPVAAEESRQALQGAGGVLAANRGPFRTAAELDVRDLRQHLVDPVGGCGLDFAPGRNRDARSGVLDRSRDPFAGDDDALVIDRCGRGLCGGRGASIASGTAVTSKPAPQTNLRQ